MQGRNFSLKVGVPIQKENEAPSSPEAKVEENREEVSLLINSGVWESVMSSSSGVQSRNGFIAI